MTITRRTLLTLAGAATVQAAMAGALRAEGGASPTLAYAHRTPQRIGAAALRVRDLGPMVDYYSAVIGLRVIERDASEATLGLGGVPLLHLLSRPDALPEARNSAGLYHIAWLMPSRAALADWLVHVAISRVPVTGFADHHVSEAVYLDDPEGNGIEVYADRPQTAWEWNVEGVRMGTEPLDVDGLLLLGGLGGQSWAGAPEGMRIGHMHLRVGDLAPARDFYQTVLGLDATRARGGAAFLSSGRYHHHLGLNVWESGGAGPREAGRTGLDWFSLEVRDRDLLGAQAGRLAAQGLLADGGGAPAPGSDRFEARDPWGTTVRLVAI